MSCRTYRRRRFGRPLFPFFFPAGRFALHSRQYTGRLEVSGRNGNSSISLPQLSHLRLNALTSCMFHPFACAGTKCRTRRISPVYCQHTPPVVQTQAQGPNEIREIGCLPRRRLPEPHVRWMCRKPVTACHCNHQDRLPADN